MTNKKFIHELPEARILVEQIAQSRQIRAQLVEKDYWIMHALRRLKTQSYVANVHMLTLSYININI